ncbi:L-rhamnose-1-dehydrogenase [Aspergillus lentulus]|nr:L-rhamnose-1-dehydrogenase [Aspergillus lentulus]
MGLLHEKVVVITGSSSGIGRGCAFECAAQGAKIVLHHLGTSQTEQDAKALQDELRNQFFTTSIVYGVDLTDDEGPQKLIDAAVSRLGHIDILVNNAAIFKPLPADQVTKTVVANHANVNFVALYLVTQAATRHMVERGKGGSIVTICSNTAVVGTSNVAHYAGSKAAGLALMQNLAVEYGPHAIRYNCVLPGPTDTQMVAEYVNDPKEREATNARCPMGRIATPTDIARAVVFFASDLSSFVTGQHIVVDGGSSYRFL